MHYAAHIIRRHRLLLSLVGMTLNQIALGSPSGWERASMAWKLKALPPEPQG